MDIIHPVLFIPVIYALYLGEMMKTRDAFFTAHHALSFAWSNDLIQNVREANEITIGSSLRWS